MPRQMRDPRFRSEQHRDRYAPHVAPINRLVDELRRPGPDGWLPYVAPVHGGAAATILSVLRDPGPMTRDAAGSGFLCIENDDPTAERQALAFEAVGIGAGDLTPWNAYPWYINARPGAAQLEAGVEPLLRLLALLPAVRVVLLQGTEAQSVWRRALRRRPDIERARNLTVIGTYHPGRQALFHPDPTVRADRARDRDEAYQRAAAAIR